MKTVRDAVIAENGVWDCSHDYLVWTGKEWSYMSVNDACQWPSADCIHKSSFYEQSKRMGYIRGYLWGKEYPTNGKRPDLPDDIECSVHVSDNPLWWGHGATVSQWDWPNTVAFLITDPRYKPVDEVSKISESKPDAESVSEKPESNWFERGDHPAIGSKVTIVRGHTDF